MTNNNSRVAFFSPKNPLLILLIVSICLFVCVLNAHATDLTELSPDYQNAIDNYNELMDDTDTITISETDADTSASETVTDNTTTDNTTEIQTEEVITDDTNDDLYRAQVIFYLQVIIFVLVLIFAFSVFKSLF